MEQALVQEAVEQALVQEAVEQASEVEAVEQASQVEAVEQALEVELEALEAALEAGCFGLQCSLAFLSVSCPGAKLLLLLLRNTNLCHENTHCDQVMSQCSPELLAMTDLKWQGYRFITLI